MRTRRLQAIALPTALLGALGVGVGLVVTRSGTRGVVHATPSAPAAPPSLAQDLTAFRVALDGFRGGDQGALASLEATAQRLSVAGRPDVALVLSFYRALPLAARRAGWDDEQEFQKLRQRVLDAERAHATSDEWKDERADVVRQLDRLIEDVRTKDDFVPAARALSLRARLAVDQAENDAELAFDARDELAVIAGEEARAAVELFTRAGFVTPQLEPLWILGRVARARGEIAAADEHFTRCLELARNVANGDFERHALDGLLAQARADGDVERAARLVHELARLDDATQSWPLVRMHADLLLARDEADCAVDLLQRFALAEGSNDDWRVRLAGALTRAGRHQEARRTLEESAGTRQGEVDLQRAVIDLAESRPSSALSAARRVLAQEDLDATSTTNARWIAGEALLRLDRCAQARVELAAALESGERIQESRMRARDTRSVAANVLGEVVGLHAVALYAEACVREDAALEAAFAIERHQAQLLRADLSRASADQELSISDLAAWAAHFESGLVTWVVGANTSVVVHVANDGNARGVALPIGRRALEMAARRLREAAIAGDEAHTDALAREIESALFTDALLERLRAGTGRLLCLVHGPIEGLALERLPLFADETLAPVCLPGLPSARPGDELAHEDYARWNLLGAPVDAASAELLPGTRLELDDLATLLGTARVARGPAFDRAALSAALTEPRALHVATHAIHSARCESGRFASVGLELSNGDVLCAREIAALRPALPLAFLSACETGGGTFVDAQGLQGLARAFLESGTRNLLVTLWPVEDRAARAFASAFHRALLAGASPAVAAARARVELRAQGVASSEWAAFRALGRD